MKSNNLVTPKNLIWFMNPWRLKLVDGVDKHKQQSLKHSKNKKKRAQSHCLFSAGHFVKNWKERYFILQSDKLFYFKSKTVTRFFPQVKVLM